MTHEEAKKSRREGSERCKLRKEKRKGEINLREFGRLSRKRRIRVADGGNERRRYFQWLYRRNEVTLCVKTSSEELSLPCDSSFDKPYYCTR